MQAVTVVPGTAGSAKLDEVPEPAADLGSVVVEALAVGVCGTDAEIAGGSYGWLWTIHGRKPVSRPSSIRHPC
jgi:glucose 1-dehydrogenase